MCVCVCVCACVFFNCATVHVNVLDIELKRFNQQSPLEKRVSNIKFINSAYVVLWIVNAGYQCLYCPEGHYRCDYMYLTHTIIVYHLSVYMHEFV